MYHKRKESLEYLTYSREEAAMERKGTRWHGGSVMGESIERGRNKLNICNKM